MNCFRFVAVCALLGGSVHAHAGAYIFTDLGTLGGRESYAVAINNSGQVIGHSGQSHLPLKAEAEQ